MPGRRLLDEPTLIDMGYDRPDFVARRAVLRQTLHAFEDHPHHFHTQATKNLDSWSTNPQKQTPKGEVRVIEGDWGEVAGALTRAYGACFAVLNMANAFKPGGAYIEGTAAQEENMFRRTDCHFRVGPDEIDPSTDRYRAEMTRLLSAEGGRVFLDTDHPRVCIRGPEDRADPSLGYPWLSKDAIFPFFELRAAAQDLRVGRTFDEANARARIRAQLHTLLDANIRHAVLSAFGCGAFHNPADTVARLYREEIARCRDHFALIAFAIFHPGYGPDNHAPFASAFADF